MGEKRRLFLMRAAFLALLGGGLVIWGEMRRPRELRLELDLTRALPGEIAGVDLVVRRGERALARDEMSFGKEGAPGTLEFRVRAAPGEAEVEATLTYAAKPARRASARVKLSEDAPVVVHVD
jgi:hypothetical protein